MKHDELVKEIQAFYDETYERHIHNQGPPDPFIEMAGKVCEDMLGLLNTIKPRLMTREEVIQSINRPIWVEDLCNKRIFGGCGRWVIPERFSDFNDTMEYSGPGDYGLHVRSISAYGKLWRCWTNEPTIEQEEAEPWVK